MDDQWVIKFSPALQMHFLHFKKYTYHCNVLGSFCVWHKNLWFSEQVSNQSRFSEDVSCRTNLDHDSDHLHCSFQTDLPIGLTDSLENVSLDTHKIHKLFIILLWCVCSAVQRNAAPE